MANAVTLEGIAATLDALLKSNDEAHERIESRLERMNGTVRTNCDRITRLEEQQNVRTGALGALSIGIGAVAAWLGMRQ